MSHTGVEKKRRSRLSRIVNIGIVVGVLGVLAAIAIPNNLQATRRGPRSRAASDTKTAVTQAMVYTSDKGVYPTSLKVMREEGYANVTDKDPWGNDYVLSPVLTRGSKPREGDNVYVYSRGPKGTGVYPHPFTKDTGPEGAIGYSTVDGSWGAPLSRNGLWSGWLDIGAILIVVICVYFFFKLIKLIALLIDQLLGKWGRSWIVLAAICNVAFLAIFAAAGGGSKERFFSLLVGVVFWFFLFLLAPRRKADSEDQLSRDDSIRPISWS